MFSAWKYRLFFILNDYSGHVWKGLARICPESVSVRPLVHQVRFVVLSSHNFTHTQLSPLSFRSRAYCLAVSFWMCSPKASDFCNDMQQPVKALFLLDCWPRVCLTQVLALTDRLFQRDTQSHWYPKAPSSSYLSVLFFLCEGCFISIIKPHHHGAVTFLAGSPLPPLEQVAVTAIRPNTPGLLSPHTQVWAMGGCRGALSSPPPPHTQPGSPRMDWSGILIASVHCSGTAWRQTLEHHAVLVGLPTILNKS